MNNILKEEERSTNIGNELPHFDMEDRKKYIKFTNRSQSKKGRGFELEKDVLYKNRDDWE